MSLLGIRGLSVAFATAEGPARAVDDVSFDIAPGETVALIGESGSGKTTVAHAILRLIPSPSGCIAGGSVEFDGQDLVRVDERRIRDIRGRAISMIFQDPLSALNPIQTIGRQMCEVLRIHEGASRGEAAQRAIAMLSQVGMPAPEAQFRQYAHNLSGGMRQRAMIAMALLCRPKLLIADEPTSALDVTIQAQVLALIGELQAKFGMAVLLITHDFGVVAEIARRVVVMYAGRKVEDGPVEEIFYRPMHPYTRGLLGATRSTSRCGFLPEIPGTVPSLTALPPGCSFAPRCPHARERCRAGLPQPRELAPTHRVACFVAQEEHGLA